MDAVFDIWAGSGLCWLPEHGVGYYPVQETDKPYDKLYFAKYQGYARTELGRQITAFRVDLVNKYTRGQVVDVGIGCGQFIEARGRRTLGYDINPAGVNWLKRRGAYLDVYAAESVESIACWDSLEHIDEPGHLLDRVSKFVFVSIPIFDGPDHVLRSKHFRRDEHYWYFTDAGLRKWMGGHGFECLEHTTEETRLGREDIGSYVFKRR